MTATTWVQIIKAVLLLAGASFMALMVMSQFGFSPEAMFAKAVEIKSVLAAKDAKVIADATAKGVDVAVVAAAKGESIMAPGSFVKDPISAISFGMALMFGTAGLPHILMRFFTVPDAKEARKSVFWATTWIGYFYILIFIIGFGAITLVLTNPEMADAGTIKGGAGAANMAAVLVAKMVGGNVFFGFISAVVFATVLKKGQADSASELKVSRITTLVLGIVAVLLGIAFEKQNVAFMVSLAFAIAASANFPVLILSLLWKDCTTRGAVIGGFLGLVSSVGLTLVSPSVWEATLGNPEGSAWFPYTSPALFSMAIAFVGIWFF